MTSPVPPPVRPRMPPLVKLAVDLGPLLVFFVANARAGIFAATGAFMAAVVVALALSFGLERRLAVMPLVTGVVVMVFGGLTLYLNDETFIKIKPTIVYALFAAILYGGLASGRALVKPLMNAVYAMDDRGWHRLTHRWAAFFVAMAFLNEVLWRSLSTDAWVTAKVFGFLPLTLLFALAQIPLMQRHRVEEEAG